MAAAITQTANPSGVNASSNVATYSSVSIGTAASDRIVVVLVGVEDAGGTINSCTIDYGSGDTAMTAGTGANQGNVYSQLFYLAVPTGTTATIKVTYGTTPTSTENHIAVYKVTGAEYSSKGSDSSSDMDTNDPVTTGSITIPTDGGFLAITACQNDTNAKTWANATEDIDDDAGGYRFTTAYRTTAGTVTITCTGITNNEDGAMSWIIFDVAPTGTPANSERDAKITGLAQDPPTVVLNSPDDESSGTDATPTLEFTGTDANDDDVRYNVQIHTDNAFGGQATNAVAFNGSNQYGAIPNWSGIDDLTDGTITIETWVKNSSSSAAYSRPFCTFNGSTSVASLSTENGTGNTGVNFKYDYGAGTDADGYKTSGVLDQDTWVHVALVCENGQKTKVFKNGTEISYDLQNTPSGTPTSWDSVAFYLGQAGNSTGYFDGSVGGFFRVWKDVRTQTELNNNKSTHITGDSDLIINLMFLEGSGSTIDNEASAGNDLTLYNSPTWETGPTITGVPLLNKVSGTDDGFANTTDGGDTDPFDSGDKASFTVQAGDTLSADTYYWRVRGTDPSGSNTYGAWSSTRSFTITSGTETNDERDAKVTGKAISNAERDAKVTGKNTANAERDSKITGKASANAERDSKITGVDTDADERAAKVTGMLGANSSRSAKITGKSSDNDERDAKITGKLTATSERGATINGKATDERDARITGKNTDNDDRSAKITGTTVASSYRSAKVTGVDTDSDSRDAKVTGKLTDNDERSAKVVGQDSSYSERSAKITGTPAEDQATDERNAKVTGKDSSSSERNAKVTGKLSIDDERSAKVTGILGANSARSAKISGTSTDSDERSAKVTGKIGTYSTRSAKTTGKAQASAERDSKVVGKLTATSERGAVIVGNATANDQRNAKLTGDSDTNSERNAKITGKNTADSERNAVIIGIVVGGGVTSERSAEITGKLLDTDERSAKITGVASSSSERNAVIVGTGVIFTDNPQHWYTDDPKTPTTSDPQHWYTDDPKTFQSGNEPDWKWHW